MAPGSTNHMRSLENFKQAVTKLKLNEILFSKKYIPSAKTLYTEYLSNITFNYLCENLPNFSCHFGTKNHFSRRKSYIFFSSNITYFLQTQLIKVQIFWLSNNFQTITNVIFHVIFHVVFLQSLNHSTVPERSFFYTFPSKSSYALGKRSPSKCSFSEFQLFA